MHCRLITHDGPDGQRVVGFACGPRPRQKPCAVCRRRPGTKLCDGPVRRPKARASSGATGTCDAPLCEDCADHRAGDKDYCPTCSPPA